MPGYPLWIGLVADDMGYNLMRMGRTTISEGDHGYQLCCSGRHRWILAKPSVSLMMFSLPETAANMLKDVEKFEEGDVIICNDPYLGGQHLLICSSSRLSFMMVS
jgi:N-methylhydantoinase B/oxoprolinase/acetone carboxylase alpha subunit